MRHDWKQTGPDEVACRHCGIEPHQLHAEAQEELDRIDLDHQAKRRAVHRDLAANLKTASRPSS